MSIRTIPLDDRCHAARPVIPQPTPLSGSGAARKALEAWEADMAAAEREGYRRGVTASCRHEYATGWAWGAVCGCTAGALITGILVGIAHALA